MPSATSLLAVVLLAASLAGCAGGPTSDLDARSGSSPEPVGAGPPAPTAVANETRGSLAGLVLDGEGLPVAGVDVSVLSADLRTPFAQTRSDATGRFTVNDLAPGDYALVLKRVGFDEVVRRTTVRVGEVTQVELTMNAVAVSTEPYHDSVSSVAHIKAGYVFLGTLGDLYNQTGAYSNLCDPCKFVYAFAPAPIQVVREAHWQSPVSAPAVNEEIYFQYYVGWSDSSAGTLAESGYSKNRATHSFDGAGLEAFKTANSTLLRISGGFVSVNFDHKPEVWTTFAYVAELPAGFTALPPE